MNMKLNKKNSFSSWNTLNWILPIPEQGFSITNHSNYLTCFIMYAKIGKVLSFLCMWKFSVEWNLFWILIKIMQFSLDSYSLIYFCSAQILHETQQSYWLQIWFRSYKVLSNILIIWNLYLIFICFESNEKNYLNYCNFKLFYYLSAINCSQFRFYI